MNQQGEANHNAKLRATHVRAMRKSYAGGATVSALARRFLVPRSHVRRIVQRKAWVHV